MPVRKSQSSNFTRLYNFQALFIINVAPTGINEALDMSPNILV